MTRYLTRDEVLDLHLYALERWGGRFGIRSQDRLLSALQAPQQVMFGAELYPNLADKVAVLGFQLLKHRPFTAGNEATGMLVMLRMLAVNRVTISPRAVDGLVRVLRRVLNSQMNREELAQWLRTEYSLPTPQLP